VPAECVCLLPWLPQRQQGLTKRFVGAVAGAEK
jgi:hypothetical protein